MTEEKICLVVDKLDKNRIETVHIYLPEKTDIHETERGSLTKHTKGRKLLLAGLFLFCSLCIFSHRKEIPMKELTRILPEFQDAAHY